ncbi:glycosyltransferase family 4 protein [Klebsiella pneumoniae]|uniref:Glycosyl transferase n=1 Tax=Klebsiella sp. 5281 TaxID=1497820 RepID=A0A0P0YRE7_9ENTR|nr:glycosyltransferase family 4 protein [Klebsiella pneumoniae]BAT23858.1 glycosyl transferase [Klebsiella sp. 5281]SAS87410.1 glycosyl transferase family protein [Klebsiella pneumoniae]STW16832.1 glycosyl transferase family protein [Klebsiella pneumoniae]SWD89570.1 glycosyl transferase family protein [Klebsiella pneumoniae]
MKVAIINTLYYPYRLGGAEVSVQVLAESLVKRNVEVIVLTLHEGNTLKIDTFNGVKIYYLPLLNCYWPYNSNEHSKIHRLQWHIKDLYNKQMVKLVSSILQDLRPDIVHTNNLSGFSVGVWRVLRKMNIPTVHTTRDYYLFHPNSTLFKNGKNIDPTNFFVRLNVFYKKYMSKDVNAFIGISKYISDFHYKFGFANKGLHGYVYNPVMEPKVTNSNTDRDKITIGYIGRLTSDKGFDDYINIAQKYQHCKFLAAGKPDASEESRDLLKKAKKSSVEILGYIPVEEFLNKVDAVLLPIKWNEPFGRVVVESALAYKPVYTNYVGGITEISSFFPWVKDIHSFDEQELKCTISSVTQTLRDKQNPFCSEIHVDNYLKIYNEVVKNNKMVKA